MSDAPMIRWSEDGTDHTALWRSEAGLPPPKRVLVADDTLNADQAYRLACEGTALLWRGDFHNGRQLLQALARRIERKQPKGKGKASKPASLTEAFHLHRQAQGQRARILAMLLIAVDADYRVSLRRAPDFSAACAEAYGPAGEPFVVSLRELQALVGAHEWRRKGVSIPALGAAIHPHYGVFSPLRGEYLELLAQPPFLPRTWPSTSAPAPASSPPCWPSGAWPRWWRRIWTRGPWPAPGKTWNAWTSPPGWNCSSGTSFPRGGRPWWCATRPGCRPSPAPPSNTPSSTRTAACCAASWPA